MSVLRLTVVLGARDDLWAGVDQLHLGGVGRRQGDGPGAIGVGQGLDAIGRKRGLLLGGRRRPLLGRGGRGGVDNGGGGDPEQGEACHDDRDDEHLQCETELSTGHQNPSSPSSAVV
jgi:hypothetical protein